MPLEDRRAALISATEPLLERYGRDVSTRQIAEAAGVAEGTIFRAFATKDELIDAVVDEVLDERRTRDAIAAIDRALPLPRAARRRGDGAAGPDPPGVRPVPRAPAAARAGPAASGEDRPAHETLHARQRHDQEQLELVLLDLIGPDAARLRVSPGEAVTVLRATVFALTHPLLGDERLARPDRIVDLVLHGVVRHTPPNEDPAC